MENKLKVLMINGSPRKDGNTSIALREMEKVFQENGVEVETVQVGNKAIRGCVACNSCAEKGKCVFDDVVNELAPKFEEADGLVVASPVYYASANATLIACLDRLFYSTPFDKTMKVGAGVACARRGATLWIVGAVIIVFGLCMLAYDTPDDVSSLFDTYQMNGSAGFASAGATSAQVLKAGFSMLLIGFGATDICAFGARYMKAKKREQK